MRIRLPLLLSSVLLAACGSSSGDSNPLPATDSGSPGDGSGDVVVDSAPEIAIDSGCSTPIAPDPLSLKRAACTYAAGAKVADTLGVTDADRKKLPISHVIVVMKENRSFDHYFGKRSDVEGIPADFTNPDTTGAKVAFTHETNSCFPYDPEHQWVAMHAQYDDGKMDGFIKNAAARSVGADDSTPVTTDGHYVMTYRERADLPFYNFLGDTYALADHYFSSAISGTWANRLYLYAGTSYGVKDTGKDFVKADATGIFEALTAAKVTWGVYSDDTFPLDGALLTAGWDSSHAGVGKVQAFFDAIKNGTLPQVVFIDAGLNTEDEHPPGDLQVGEAWTKKIYDAITGSSYWLDKDGKGVAMIWTYDESGGFADHVAPPKACVASPDQAEFDHLGFRVPFVMISPFARKKYVSHVEHSHTSITRFIELLFDVPAMTARDANSDALLDMFDFGCPAMDKPPTPPSPATGGCKK